MDEDGRLQVRLGVQLWSELQYTLTECSVIIDNVEEYVVKAEKEMFGQTSGVDAEAVSINLHSLFCIMLSHSTLNAAV